MVDGKALAYGGNMEYGFTLTATPLSGQRRRKASYWWLATGKYFEWWLWIVCRSAAFQILPSGMEYSPAQDHTFKFMLEPADSSARQVGMWRPWLSMRFFPDDKGDLPPPNRSGNSSP